jgi:hypothetical protein
MTMRQSGSASSLLVWSGLNFSRLANMLNVIGQGKKHPSTDTVEQALTTATVKHRKHLDAIQMESRWITRLESCQGRLMTAFGCYLAPHCADLFRAGCRAHFLLWQSAAIPALDGPCGKQLTRAGVVEYMGSVQAARCVLEDGLSVFYFVVYGLFT